MPVISEQFYISGVSHILHANLATVFMLLIGLHLLSTIYHYKVMNIPSFLPVTNDDKSIGN